MNDKQVVQEESTNEESKSTKSMSKKSSAKISVLERVRQIQVKFGLKPLVLKRKAQDSPNSSTSTSPAVSSKSLIAPAPSTASSSKSGIQNSSPSSTPEPSKTTKRRSILRNNNNNNDNSSSKLKIEDKVVERALKARTQEFNEIGPAASLLIIPNENHRHSSSSFDDKNPSTTKLNSTTYTPSHHRESYSAPSSVSSPSQNFLLTATESESKNRSSHMSTKALVDDAITATTPLDGSQTPKRKKSSWLLAFATPRAQRKKSIKNATISTPSASKSSNTPSLLGGDIFTNPIQTKSKSTKIVQAEDGKLSVNDIGKEESVATLLATATYDESDDEINPEELLQSDSPPISLLNNNSLSTAPPNSLQSQAKTAESSFAETEDVAPPNSSQQIIEEDQLGIRIIKEDEPNQEELITTESEEDLEKSLSNFEEDEDASEGASHYPSESVQLEALYHMAHSEISDAVNSTQKVIDPSIYNHLSVTEQLHRASLEGDLERIKMLVSDAEGQALETGASPSQNVKQLINSIDASDRSTPLHKAAARNNYEIIKFLVDAGAVLDATDQLNSQPLHWAAANKHVEAIQLLCKFGAPVNIRDCYGYSPLHLAMKKQCLKGAEILLLYGADINFKTMSGMTALHLCCETGDMEAIEWLLSKEKIIVNLRDKDGDTPLFRAVATSQVGVVEYLLNVSKVSSWNVRNGKGQSILHRAAIKGDKEMIMLIAFKNPAICAVMLNEPDHDSRTPLHYAVLKSNFREVKTLLMMGSDLNAADRLGDTALHLAIKKSDLKMARFLYQSGANCEAKNKKQETPKQLAKKFKEKIF